MPFSPSDLSGLAIWFDASQLGLADGAAVSPWPNLASGGKPGTVVGTPAPIVRANALFGMPVVRFRISEGRVRISGIAGLDKEFTLVYVARIAGPNAGRIVSATYPPTNMLFGWWTTYMDIGYSTTGGFFVPDTRTAWTSAWKLYSGDAPAASPTWEVRLFSDGVFLGSGARAAPGPSDGWGGTFNISGYDATGTQETNDCEVAEVALYDRKLADADRQQVEGYLRDKWILGVPPAPPRFRRELRVVL
jgi:hypothetical protein